MAVANINLIGANKTIEFSSVDDTDLLIVTCFATHEGVNANGTKFTRQVLADCYKSFVDKPLVLVPNVFGEPTGHGFDFINRKFIIKDRKIVGHIQSSDLCIYNEIKGGSVELLGENDNLEEFINRFGEMRVICKIVVYKHYLTEVAQMITRLHNEGKLKFSMEGLIDSFTSEDGVKHCTDIQFTGLAIVENPAFKNSYSLDVAEEEEKGEKMDYEKMYNELKAKYDALVKEKSGSTKKEEKPEGGTSEDKKKKTGCAAVDVEKYESLVNKVADLTNEVASLKPYKEAAEKAEALKIGKKRLDTLTKFGYEEKSAEELAEINYEEYASLLEKTVEASTKVTEETAETKPGVQGVLHHNTTSKSDFESLKDILAEIVK